MSGEERMKYVTLTDEVTVTTYYKDFHTDYDTSGSIYDKIITKTDNHKNQTTFMLENSPEFAKYHMTNNVYRDAYESASLVARLKIVFLVAGLVAGFISAFMLLNFVAVSISIKRKEIGVLRAVGARSMDVFKIFFAESLIIVLTCFIIASVAGYFVCDLVNMYTMKSFISIKLFNYGILSVLMILVISLIVAFIATYIPVRSAAKKPPVDSMREL
jgi:ABC-type antimicrobial peptide transport system permease subunit